MFLSCLMTRINGWWQGFLYAIAVSSAAWLIALIVAVVVSAIGGGPVAWASLGTLAVIFGSLILTFLTAMLVMDVIACAAAAAAPSGPGSGGGSGSGSSGLTSAVDCPTAQSTLAAAKARAEQLRRDVDAQAAKVAAAQQAAANARAALTLSIAGLAASFFAPWAIPAALVAVAAASYLSWRTQQDLVREMDVLGDLAATLGRAQAEVAAGEVIAAQACSQPTVSIGPGVGLTLGALRQIVRGIPARRSVGDAAAV